MGDGTPRSAGERSCKRRPSLFSMSQTGKSVIGPTRSVTESPGPTSPPVVYGTDVTLRMSSLLRSKDALPLRDFDTVGYTFGERCPPNT